MAMPDEEIIKALENCTSHSPCCPLCKYDAEYDISSECMGALMIDALDLINRKDAEKETLRDEIERLNKILENRGEICKLCEGKYTEKIKHAKAEAIKEFAEKLKCRSHRFKTIDRIFVDCIPLDYIDNLVKEMVGD